MQVTGCDWTTAEVRDGRLTVSLERKPPKGWSESFERTARLLNRGRFTRLRLKHSAIQIEPVVPGEEEVVRHFLESLFQEANAQVGAREPESRPERAPEDGAADPDDTDGAMTARFRAFASEGDASDRTAQG